MDAGLRDRWTEEAHRRIAAAGLRTGAAREAVVDHLAQAGQCLLTAQEVTDGVRSARAGSPSSVYRVLEQLHELGLLHRVDGRDGVARYEVADPAGHHHHWVDEVTGRPVPFTDPELEEAIAATARRLGLELTEHEVLLRGRRAG